MFHLNYLKCATAVLSAKLTKNNGYVSLNLSERATAKFSDKFTKNNVFVSLKLSERATAKKIKFNLISITIFFAFIFKKKSFTYADSFLKKKILTWRSSKRRINKKKENPRSRTISVPKNIKLHQAHKKITTHAAKQIHPLPRRTCSWSSSFSDTWLSITEILGFFIICPL